MQDRCKELLGMSFRRRAAPRRKPAQAGQVPLGGSDHTQ